MLFLMFAIVVMICLVVYLYYELRIAINENKLGESRWWLDLSKMQQGTKFRVAAVLDYGKADERPAYLIWLFKKEELDGAAILRGVDDLIIGKMYRKNDDLTVSMI